MKNYITILFLLIGISALSQVDTSSSDHLMFKGVPIDGTLDEYVSKMKKSGFTLEGKDKGVAVLNGDFAGYKDCKIGVVTFNQKDIVSKIAVIFPEQDIWSRLSGDYFRLQELLIEKYGKPSESIENFQNRDPKDDNSKMHEVRMDRCKYSTTFETEKGIIELSIENNESISGYVMLSYFDKINTSIVRENAIDDL